MVVEQGKGKFYKLEVCTRAKNSHERLSGPYNQVLVICEEKPVCHSLCCVSVGSSLWLVVCGAQLLDALIRLCLGVCRRIEPECGTCGNGGLVHRVG